MIEKIRNIGIIAHVDAGKTTTTERVLYFAGAKHRSGDVDSGNTTTDFDPLEAEKGIAISSAAVTVEWEGHPITIIDTPGHVDFTAEVERSLRVLDGAVGVFCAVGGVEVQSETVWFQANKHNVPRIAFVNKMDRMGADFAATVEQIEQKLNANVALCAMPAGQSSEFAGVIDLVAMKYWWMDPTDPKHCKYELQEIPAAYKEEADMARERLLDVVSQTNDEVLTLLLEGQAVSEELLRRAIREGTLAMKFFPVLCGSAFQFHGVHLLLNSIIDYLPSPKDRPPVTGTVLKTKTQELRGPNPKEPFSALAFKTVSESHGDFVYTRIYSGTLVPGEMYLNSVTGKTERVSHVFRMFGARRDRLEKAEAGDIVAIVGLKNTATGHTLCDTAKPVVLEEIRFPEPVISQALILDKDVDEARLAEALGKMVRDDPTLRCQTDQETKQLILSGMGELHLEVAVHKLQRDHRVKVTVGKPMVSYRQTLGRTVELEYRYVKQTGGRGQYAVIQLRFEPLSKEEREELELAAKEAGEKPDLNGLYFVNDIFGGAIPGEYVPAVEKGFREAARRGGKHGFQFVDMKCTLFDGKHHEVDSSQLAFQRAAEEAFLEAISRAGIVLLEPIMEVVVQAPGNYLGDLTRDVSRRRGEITHSELEKGRAVLQAYVPLACLFGYTSDLRNFTSGTASFSMEPSHYSPVKEELADLPKKNAGKDEASKSSKK
ncbi:MAG TPA: elongation factor G [Gemmatales bacterium]|nr:elongation factor G [Gemmatales bacterium]